MFSPIIFFLLISLAYVTQSADEHFPTFACEEDSGTTCTLKGLHLSKDQQYFNISVDHHEEVLQVYLYDSVIPVLSNSICDTFPALQLLDASNCKIEIINEDAFNGCLELNTLILTNNKIKNLHVHTFRHNNKLTGLFFENNRIKCIDEGTFDNLVDLTSISFGNNNLTEFSPRLLEKNQKIDSIYLWTNNLSDFDLETLHKTNPNSVYYIYLNQNEFSCVRLQEMLEFANDNNNIQLSRKAAGERTRYYEVNIVDYFTCLGDVAWASNHYRKQIEKSC